MKIQEINQRELFLKNQHNKKNIKIYVERKPVKKHFFKKKK